MSSLHPWFVYLHIAGVFGFLMAHGVSAGVALRLGSEREPERIRALLDLSGHAIRFMYLALLLLLAGGVAAGFSGGWWGQLWIWAALVVLVLIFVGMQVRGSGYYTSLRKAIGAQYFEGRKVQPPLPPKSAEEIAALVSPARGMELLGIGVVGLLIILWLMVLKPF
jgi:hypothetical protein